jgi:hypothetical protein
MSDAVAPVVERALSGASIAIWSTAGSKSNRLKPGANVAGNTWNRVIAGDSLSPMVPLLTGVTTLLFSKLQPSAMHNLPYQNSMIIN